MGIRAGFIVTLIGIVAVGQHHHQSLSPLFYSVCLMTGLRLFECPG